MRIATDVNMPVDLTGVRTEVWVGVIIADGVLKKHGFEAIVTAGIEGSHSWGSKHWSGDAVDLRSRMIPEERLHDIAEEIREALGTHLYDLVVEATHLHLEWHPKMRSRSRRLTR